MMTSQPMAPLEQTKYSVFRQQPLFRFKWLVKKKEKNIKNTYKFKFLKETHDNNNTHQYCYNYVNGEVNGKHTHIQVLKHEGYDLSLPLHFYFFPKRIA